MTAEVSSLAAAFADLERARSIAVTLEQECAEWHRAFAAVLDVMVRSPLGSAVERSAAWQDLLRLNGRAGG